MSKFIQAIRKFFARKADDTQESGGGKSENNLQKPNKRPHPYDDVSVPEGSNEPGVNKDNAKANNRRPHPYDDVTVPGDSTGPEVTSDSQNKDSVQVAPKRAPRPYDDVDVPLPNESGGKIEVR